MKRSSPRAMGGAITALAEGLAPQTPLAALQRIWEQTVGELVAAQAEPTAAHDGVVVVTCSSAVWAQELDLIADDLIERLNSALGGGAVRALRCQAAPARGWARQSARG